jgi:hypothetical protein
LRVERRDFLLLRAGQPAVLSCEQLFMRYLDSQREDRTAQLFSSLEEDLRAVTTVRLTDISWLSRDDLKQRLDGVLNSFATRGGKVIRALVVALLLAGASYREALADSPIAPKSGASLCGALTAADFAAAGVRTNPKPTANVQDAGASVYCVYAGKSGVTGGVELDVFYPAGANVADAKTTLDTAAGEVSSPLAPIAIPGVDEARWSANTKSGGPAFAVIVVRRSLLVFTVAIPSGQDARTKLLKLVDVALRRF